jgi:transcriptional regulator with XRE-family HTH domain
MANEWPDDEPIDELIVRVRTEKGKSQYTLADALREVSGNPSVDRDYVSRWESRKRIPTPYWRNHLSAALQIPLDALDRAVAVAHARRALLREKVSAAAGGADYRADHGGQGAIAVAPTVEPTQAEASSPTLEEILDLWDALMRRRDLFAFAGTAAATALVPGWPAAASVRPEFDGQEVSDTCAELTATYRRLDNLLGPNAVYGQAIDHHQRLATWLRQARDADERKKLGRLTADSGDLAGWLCFDLEQYDQACGLYRQAAEAARHSDDGVSRQAYLIGRISRTLSECGQHQHALMFADEAARFAGSRATPFVRSWLIVTRSYVHACLGNESACRRDIEDATELLGRAGEEPREDYIAFYGLAHLHKWSGHALLKLGERKVTAAAEGGHAIDEAFKTWSKCAVRESAEVLTARASARLAQREIPEAARLTGQAYGIAVKTQSPRNLRHIRNLRVRLRPYRHTPAVRGLDEQLGL